MKLRMPSSSLQICAASFSSTRYTVMHYFYNVQVISTWCMVEHCLSPRCTGSDISHGTDIPLAVLLTNVCCQSQCTSLIGRVLFYTKSNMRQLHMHLEDDSHLKIVLYAAPDRQMLLASFACAC